MHFCRRTLLSALAALAVAPVAQAQSWPGRPVRIITGFAAGSASDIVARLLAQSLQTEFGQPFIVENRPGASGILAAETVAKSPADGYTLLLTTNTLSSSNPHLFKKLPYDALKDFTPIARVCNFLFVLAVPGDSSFRTTQELKAYATAQRGKLSFAYGNSTAQIAGAAFNTLLGLEALAVPYKSSPQALTALASGEVQFLFNDLASSRALIKSGKIRALAVTTAHRSALAPELPTIAESANLPGFDLAAWVGVIGPARMPADVTQRLSVAINAALKRPEVSEKLTSLGADVFPGTAAELQQYMVEQHAGWREKIKAAGIQPE